jgi:hypothetical protein
MAARPENPLPSGLAEEWMKVEDLPPRGARWTDNTHRRMALRVWRGRDAALSDVVHSRIVVGAYRVLDIWRVPQGGCAGLVRLSKLRERHI